MNCLPINDKQAAPPSKHHFIRTHLDGLLVGLSCLHLSRPVALDASGAHHRPLLHHVPARLARRVRAVVQHRPLVVHHGVHDLARGGALKHGWSWVNSRQRPLSTSYLYAILAVCEARSEAGDPASGRGRADGVLHQAVVRVERVRVVDVRCVGSVQGLRRVRPERNGTGSGRRLCD